MKTNILLKLTVSALMLGAVTIGCKPTSNRPASLSSVAPKADRQAAKLADKGLAALRARDSEKAIAFAEQAVALSPRNADYRELLGQAYLLGGRFTSAEMSFSDSLTLDSGHARSALNLALTQIALGKTAAARQTLAAVQGKVPESDRGLALALAGDRDAALQVLERAARVEGADAKVRQNLALGYALAGRWAESRSAAAQDLGPNELRARMSDWALFSQPAASWDQVAALLGVTPVRDAGQPVALALAPLAAEPVAVAAAAKVEAAPVVLAQAEAIETPIHSEPAPAVEMPVVAAAAPVAEPLPTSAAPYYVQPVGVPAPPALIAGPRKPAKVSLAAVTAVASVRQSARGKFVVQLGAYSSEARTEVAWKRQVRRIAPLAAYMPSVATYGMRNAGTVHRLTLAGFESRGAAVRLCSQVRAHGGECFVRSAAGEQSARWFSRSAGGRGAVR